MFFIFPPDFAVSVRSFFFDLGTYKSTSRTFFLAQTGVPLSIKNEMYKCMYSKLFCAASKELTVYRTLNKPAEDEITTTLFFFLGEYRTFDVMIDFTRSVT